MILLQGQKLARHFGPQVLFENISLSIQENTRMALVGRNGTGKSTLLKMLAGLEEPSLGTVSKANQISIGYLDQYAAIDSPLTIWEEMAQLFKDLEDLKLQAQAAAEVLALDHILQDPAAYEEALKRYDTLQEEVSAKNAYGYQSEIRMVLHGFQFFPEDYDTPISRLSGGQRTRLALAKILLEKHDLLILDEPTNHLDIDTLTWLESYLLGSQSALLIVSHDQYFLDRVCTEVYEISHQGGQAYKGNYSAYLVERDLRKQQLEKAYNKQQEEIKRLEEFVAKNIVRASTTKQAQSRRKQLEKMQRIEIPKGDGRSASFQFSVGKESGNQVLNIRGAKIGYQGQALAGPIDLQIRKQEAIAIVGPNGVGKSTLLKSILGQIPLIDGVIDQGTSLSIGYYDQNLGGLNPKASVLEELWSRHRLMPEKDVRSFLGSFLFSGTDVEKTTGQLSGGEKARLSLAILALEHDNFLLLDEPTNHLDIDSKEVLEQALIDFDGTICFVSHDRYFINQVATSILEIQENGSKLYLGDYDYYLEKKAEEAELASLKDQEQTSKTENPLSNNKQTFLASKEEQKAIRSLERKVEELEKELHDLEGKIETIHLELSKEEVYTNPSLSQELQTQLQETQAYYDKQMTNWEEKMEELEQIRM